MVSWHDSTAGLQLCKVWVLPGGKAGVPKDVPKDIPRDGHCVAGSTSGGWLVLEGREKRQEFNIVYC